MEYDNIQSKQNRVEELLKLCDKAMEKGEKDKALEYILESSKLSQEVFDETIYNLKYKI